MFGIYPLVFISTSLKVDGGQSSSGTPNDAFESMTSHPSVRVEAEELAERLNRFTIFPFHVRVSFSRPEFALIAATKPLPLFARSLELSSLEPCFLCLTAGDCVVEAAFGKRLFFV